MQHHLGIHPSQGELRSFVIRVTLITTTQIMDLGLPSDTALEPPSDMAIEPPSAMALGLTNIYTTRHIYHKE